MVFTKVFFSISICFLLIIFIEFHWMIYNLYIIIFIVVYLILVFVVVYGLKHFLWISGVIHDFFFWNGTGAHWKMLVLCWQFNLYCCMLCVRSRLKLVSTTLIPFLCLMLPHFFLFAAKPTYFFSLFLRLIFYDQRINTSKMITSFLFHFYTSNLFLLPATLIIYDFFPY